MQRESSIDLIKFFLSIVIVFYHFGLVVQGGYLAVEGFFMISGYLMMRSMYRADREETLRSDATVRFVWHKYSAIFLPLLFSAIFGFLIYECLIFARAPRQILKNIPLLLFEIFPLQVAGFGGYCATGVSWYLSALFLCSALLHPFAKRDPERFSLTACPLIALLGYGLLCVQFSHLDAPCEWMLGLVCSGLVRGLAGICAGCLLYTFVARSKNRPAPSITARALFTCLEVLGWGFVLVCMIYKPYLRTSMDFVAVAALFGVLYIALSQRSLFSLVIHHKWTGVLTQISMYAFLNHYAWNQYVIRRFSEKTLVQILPWYLLGVAVFSALAWSLTHITRYSLGHITRARQRRTPTAS